MTNVIQALFARGVNTSHAASILLLLGLILFIAVAALPSLASSLVPPIEAYASAVFARWGGALVFSIPALAALWTFIRQRAAIYNEDAVLNQLEEAVDRLKGTEALSMRETFERSGLAGRDENERQFLLKTKSGQLAKRVFEDVKALRFDPIASIVGFQRGDILTWSSRVMSFQSIAVRGGVLGTFFGLIAALTSLPEILGQGANPTNGQNADRLGELVQSLSLAFGTSIAGLIAAIIIALLANAMRSDELKLVTAQERIASLVQGLCKNNLGDDDGIAKTAKELQRQLTANREDLIATRDAMQDRTQDLKDAAENLSATTKGPADHLVGHVSDLSALLERLRSTLQETTELAGRVSAAEANTLSSMKDMLETITDKQKAQIDQLIDRQIAGFETSNEQLGEKLATLETAMAGAIDKIVDNMSDLAKQAVQTEARVSLSEQSRMFETAAASAFAEQRAMLNRHGFILFCLYAAGIIGVVGLAFFSRSEPQILPQEDPSPLIVDPNVESEAVEIVDDEAPIPSTEPLDPPEPEESEQTDEQSDADDAG